MNKKLSKVFALLLAVSMLFTHFVILPIAAEPETGNEPDEIPQCVNCTAEERGEPGEPGEGNEKWITFVAATCTDYAYDEFYCDNCGGWYPVIQYDDDGYLPLYHAGIEDIEFTEGCEATCTEDGAVASFRACPICGKCFNEAGEVFIFEDEEIVAVDEDSCDQYTVFATEGDLVVAALDHDMDEGTVVAPTCVSQGYTIYACQRENCDYSYTTDYTDIDPDNHEDAGYTETPIFCGERDGGKAWTCTACNAEWFEVTDPIDPDHMEHQYEVQVIGEADCFVSATWLYHCTVCGCEEIVENVGDPLGHNFGEWIESDPTCTEDGVIGHYYCDRCGYCFDADGNVFIIQDDEPVAVEIEFEKELSEDNDSNPIVIVTPSCDATADITFATEEDLILEALEHDWDEGVVIAPNCTYEGYTIYTCQREGCGETYMDNYTVIDPNAHHEYNSVARIFPTCGQVGWTEEVRCEYCDKLLASPKEIPALEHEAGEEVNENEVPNSCTEDGSYDVVVYCVNCGEELRRETITVDASGHDPLEPIEENEIEATCTEAGYYELATYCSVCGAEIDRENVDVDALGHTFTEDDWVDEIPATCTEDGVKGYYYCERCENFFEDDGETEIEDLTIASGHDWYWDGTRIDPKCEEQGYKIHQCTVCEATERYDYVDALGHDYEAVVTDPTCTEGGYTTYTCSRCQDSYVADETDALEHDYVAVVTDPTCTEGGYTTYTCSRCQDSYVADETEALNHNYEAVVTEPTCTEGGYTTYTCSRCQDSYVADETDALNHNYEAVVTEPTCTEDGYTTYTCERCGDIVIEPGDEAPGHDWEYFENVVDPTFDEAGSRDSYRRCTVCGTEEVVAEGEDLPILDEYIRFEYELTGINGAAVAVNSGYIYVNVKMIVETDIARLYGVDFALHFDDVLTLISVDGHVFEDLKYTDLALANENHVVVLAENMGSSFANKTFERGEYAFTTLIFRVDNDFHNYEAGVEFVQDSNTEARWGFENQLVVEYEEDAVIYVATLGDADELIGLDRDDKFTSIDAMTLSLWFGENEDIEDAYEAIFDMDKDGDIDGIDFVLLHDAIAGNYGYLELGLYETQD